MHTTQLLKTVGAIALTAVLCNGGSALAGLVLPEPVTVTEYAFSLDEGSTTMLIFDVANNSESSGVWSVLIGGEHPIGTPDAGELNPFWAAEILYIFEADESYEPGTYLAFADGSAEPLFILDSDWAGYDAGYYYSTTSDPIAEGSSKAFYAYTLYPGSPFVYTTSPPEPNNNTPSGSGWTTPGSAPVPEPATVLLLGSGLVGLAGLGRSRRK